MFLLLTFPLANQIKHVFSIYKFMSLKSRHSICLLLSNGQFYIPKTLNIWINFFEKIRLWTPHVPFLVHISVHSPFYKFSYQLLTSYFPPTILQT